MTRKWRPPRWAKPMKVQKDEGCEEAIRQLLIKKSKKKKEERIDDQNLFEK